MPTIRDVARECGVSYQTVSNVFHNRPGIRPETRARVQAAMRRMDYYPSSLAQSLAGRRTNMLGIAFSYRNIRDVSGTYYGALQDGVIAAANRWDQNLVLFTGHVWADERRSLGLYNGGHCDGLLLVAPPIGSDIIPALRRARFPFVVVSDWLEAEDVSCVDVDNVRAARGAVEYLLKLGHRRIAAATLDEFLGCTMPRLQGYQQALEERGLAYDHSRILCLGSEDPRGWEALEPLMRRPAGERPTAFFCFGDPLALGVIAGLQKMGLRVPQDVSVVGFNDDPSSSQADPPLTTVRQPTRALGERAAEMLIAQIREGAAPGRKELFPTELIVRHSAAPPPPGS